MKKFLLLLFVLLLCVCLCGCGPFRPRETSPKPVRVFRVYVCGAVEREGYVEVCEGTDYISAVTMCGLLAETVVPEMPLTIITDQTKVISVGYFHDGKFCACVNLNGGLVALRAAVGADDGVIDKIADYVEAHGKITDRTLLRNILTEEEYLRNFYKFFVAEADYEKIG